MIKAYFQEDNSKAEVTVKFGDLHADIAQQVKNLIDEDYESSLDADTLTFKYPKVGFKEIEVYNYLEDLIARVTVPASELIDDDELYYTFAKKTIDEYQSEEELFDEHRNMMETSLQDSLELNALWLKKATQGAFEVEAPICGKEVKIVEETNPDFPGYSIFKQENAPEVTASQDSGLEVYDVKGMFPNPVWLEIEDFDAWLDEVTIDGDETYIVGIAVNVKFGYYMPQESDLEITINGEKPEKIDYLGTVLFIYGNVDATHPWVFDGITWNDDNTAVANYVCEKNDEHTDTVEAEVDDSNPKKLVANVSEEDSLDGQEHTDEIYKIFNLYVGGTLTTGENCDDILGDGTVSFDPETGELSLNGALIEMAKREYADDGFEYGIRSYLNNRLTRPGGVELEVPLTVKLSGNNTIVNDVDETGNQLYGIYVADEEGRDLPIEGDGTLLIEYGNNGKPARGIHYNSGKLVLDVPEVNIDITGTDDINGIHAAKLSVNSGEVTVHAEDRYAVRVDSLEVKKGAILEMICDNARAVTNTLTDDTKQLGALVNEEPSKDDAEQWDKETDLTNYKYVRIPGSHTLTIVWTSIDGDELMKTIEVTAELGKTIAEAVEDVELFEKDGYVAEEVFVPKPMSEYSTEFEMYIDNIEDTAIEKDTIVYYPMIKLINEVELSLDPPVSGDETTTPKKEDAWDWANQTNRPKISADSDEYYVMDELSLWVDNFGDIPRNPFVGTFESSKTYNGHTMVVNNYGYRFSSDATFTIENATVVNNNHGFIDFSVEIKDARYTNIQGAGNIWYKGSNVTSDFTFKRDVHDELTYSKCIGFLVDGKPLDPKNYTTEEGSIIIKLKPSYLETLSVGEHTLTALFEDGNSVTVKFYVRNKIQPYPIPVTGVE